MSTPFPPDQAQTLDLAEAAQTADSGIVRRVVLQTPELRVVLLSFADGQELAAHANPRRVLVHVLRGACDFFHSGSWHRLAAGNLLHLPPGHPHAVRAGAGPFSMLLTLGAEPCSENR